jgi:hypothetical protein
MASGTIPVNTNTDETRTLHSVTGSADTTILGGGYIKIGLVVIVSVKFTTTESHTSNTNAPIQGLPKTASNDIPLVLTVSGGVAKSCRVYNTYAFPNETIAAGTYTLSGAYISAT